MRGCILTCNHDGCNGATGLHQRLFKGDYHVDIQNEEMNLEAIWYLWFNFRNIIGWCNAAFVISGLIMNNF